MTFSRVQRKIRQQLDNGELRLNSEFVEIKHIGPYISQQLSQRFGQTIRGLINGCRNRNSTQLYELLVPYLQNERKNKCINTRGPKVHAPDVNTYAFYSIVALLIAVKNGRLGERASRNLIFSPQVMIRHTKARTESAKVCSCLTPNQCRRNERCVYVNRLCQPRLPQARGFIGGTKAKYGQKVTQENKRQAAVEGIRHQWANNQSGRQAWRIPERRRSIRIIRGP